MQRNWNQGQYEPVAQAKAGIVEQLRHHYQQRQNREQFVLVPTRCSTTTLGSTPGAQASTLVRFFADDSDADKDDERRT